MKRKLIKQGMGGVTMSLPIDWVRDRRLQPGDEVDVQMRSGTLVVGGVGSVERKKTLEISTHTHTIRSIISTLYRQGYKELELFFAKPVALNHIQQIVASLMGFEIVYQDTKRCVIRDVLQEGSIDVYRSIARMMQSTSVLYDFLLEHVTKKNQAVNISSSRKNLLTLRDSILRALQLQRYDESYDLYVLVVLLEKFASDYQFISTIKEPFNKRALDELARVQKEFKRLQKAFLAKDISLANSCFRSLRDIARSEKANQNLKEVLEKARPVVIGVYTNKLFYALFSMSSRVLSVITLQD